VDCTLIEKSLAGFHFGTLDEGERAALEAHLFGCPACVGAFLALKRAVEHGGDDPGPSEASRLALRAAVARRLRTARLRRAGLWASGAAAAAALVIALFGALRPAVDAPRTPGAASPALAAPFADPSGVIDSARDVPASLSVL